MTGLANGCFISFEGTEGAGKSTQVQLLAEALREEGHSVVVAREPGGTTVGERVRKILKEPELTGLLSPVTEFFLLCACRSELVGSVIRPALERGDIVLCDRFSDSTFAYQGFGRELPTEQLQSAIDFSTGGLVPDATIYLDIPLELSSARCRTRELAGIVGPPDRFDQSGEAFFRRVDEGFRQLAEKHPGRIHVVDGRGNVETVARDVRDAISAAELGL